MSKDLRDLSVTATGDSLAGKVSVTNEKALRSESACLRTAGKSGG